MSDKERAACLHPSLGKHDGNAGLYLEKWKYDTNFSLAVHVEVQPEANTVANGGNPGEDDQL